MSDGFVRRTLLVAAVVGGAALYLSATGFAGNSHAEQAVPTPVVPAATAVSPLTAPRPRLVTGLPDFTQLVEQVGPAVVNIRTTERVQMGASNGGFPPGMDEQMQEFMRRFFGGAIPGMPSPRQQQPDQGKQDQNQNDQGEERQRGVGSGFIVSPDGVIMTNAHVVDGADELYVTLTDKREFKGKVLGVDKRTDVAVVKIEAKALPFLQTGDVSQLKVGEWVMAIGSPFGLENTVTAGIVSAKARDTGEEIRFIQTDVAVNPGNSGGPLINMRGEVVGINSQILSRSGGFMGISFSIPIDDAMKVAEQLKTTGKVVRGRIGVQIESLSKDLADSLGMAKDEGAVVRFVEPDGPADKAGIEAGDIITRFNDQVVESVSDLPRLVGATKPGQKASLQVFRRGDYKVLTVTVAELDPEGVKTAAAEPVTPSKLAKSALGLTLSNVDAATKRDLGIAGGAQVVKVEGPSASVGIQPGDVILAMGNVKITNVAQFDALLGKIDLKRPLSVLVRRGEWAQYAVIRPNNPK